MSLWIFLALFSTGAMSAPDNPDPCKDLEIQTDLSEAAALEQARSAYITGCHSVALRLFSSMTSSDQATPSKTFLKALVFLGEVQYKLGNREASLSAFQRVLILQPNYEISILDHDPDAVALFALAKVLAEQEAEKRRNQPPPPTVITQPPSLPLAGYMPFGLPQFTQKRPVLGSFYASVQLATAAVSIGSFIHLTKKSKQTPYKPQDVKSAKVWRYAVQWPTSILFWATYIASHFQARKQWKRTHRPPSPITMDVGMGHDFVWISARFHML